MENTDDTINEKPKGNMLQNENREDEASPKNASEESKENITKKQDENVAQQPPIKTGQDFLKK
jgi:hypothetical protein